MKGSSCFKLSVFLIAMLLLPVSPVNAYTTLDYYNCTRDEPLVQAFGYLEQSSDHNIVGYMIDHGVRVLFKDMRELGKAYKDHDALSIITDDDHHIIYINSKHINAPPQALAAVIAHEIMHDDRDNSIHEEVMAWGQEAQTWGEMKTRYPELKKLVNDKIPLVDRENAIEILVTRNLLQQEITSNVAYKGLPEHSPGF